jgi:hypothetical protein
VTVLPSGRENPANFQKKPEKARTTQKRPEKARITQKKPEKARIPRKNRNSYLIEHRITRKWIL